MTISCICLPHTAEENEQEQPERAHNSDRAPT